MVTVTVMVTVVLMTVTVMEVAMLVKVVTIKHIWRLLGYMTPLTVVL
jgi:hypothetical protein